MEQDDQDLEDSGKLTLPKNKEVVWMETKDAASCSSP